MLVKSILRLCRSSGGCGAEPLAVRAGEGGITPETGPEAAFRGRQALVDEITGVDQPPVAEIIVDGLAHFLTEQAHHMEFADIKLLGQGIDGQIFRQMGIDVAQDVQNTAVFTGLRLGQFCFRIVDIPTHLGKNLQEQAGTENLVAVTLSCQFLFQADAEGIIKLPPLLAGAQNVTGSTGENIFQIAIGEAAFPEKFRTDIQDDALIRYTRLKFRPVDDMAAHQNHIARLQGIPLAVYHIAAASGPEEQELAEIVIMIVHFGALGVI